MARAEELIRLLDMSPKFVDPNPGRDHIDGLEHNLRVATLARRWARSVLWMDDSIEELRINQITFMGLVHDLARPLSDAFHGEVIAEIVRDMVTPDLYQVLRTHGQYQAALVHNDPSYICEPNAYWRSMGQMLSVWEESSFIDEWLNEWPPIMTKTEAVTLIYKICDGRD